MPGSSIKRKHVSERLQVQFPIPRTFCFDKLKEKSDHTMSIYCNQRRAVGWFASSFFFGSLDPVNQMLVHWNAGYDLY